MHKDTFTKKERSNNRKFLYIQHDTKGGTRIPAFSNAASTHPGSPDLIRSGAVRPRADRRPRRSSRRDCTRPLPKWKRTGRARGARGRFSGDSNEKTFRGLYLARGRQQLSTLLWSRFRHADGLLRLPILNGRKDLLRCSTRLDLQEKVPVS